MTDRDPLIDQLIALDPVRVDRPPVPGSARHTKILEHVMQNTPTATDRSGPGSPIPSRSTDPGDKVPLGVRRRPSRRALVALGAAAACAAVTGLVIAAVGSEPKRATIAGSEPAVTRQTSGSAGVDRPVSPVMALTRAAENTGEALTLRSEYVTDDGNGGFIVVRSEHRGGDIRRSFTVIEPDGTERGGVEGDEFVLYISNKGWRAGDGPDDWTIVRPEERNAPYAESSAAIVDASVTESSIIEIGVENVRGANTTHYRIKVTDAVIRRLSRLRPNQLSGFELESPGMLRALDVWIGDGYIRRIRVTQDWEAPDSSGTTVEFYDFGADIRIAPPT